MGGPWRGRRYSNRYEMPALGSFMGLQYAVYGSPHGLPVGCCGRPMGDPWIVGRGRRPPLMDYGSSKSHPLFKSTGQWTTLGRTFVHPKVYHDSVMGRP